MPKKRILIVFIITDALVALDIVVSPAHITYCWPTYVKIMWIHFLIIPGLETSYASQFLLCWCQLSLLDWYNLVLLISLEFKNIVSRINLIHSLSLGHYCSNHLGYNNICFTEDNFLKYKLLKYNSYSNSCHDVSEGTKKIINCK